MTRLSKISAYLLAFLALGMAVYSLVGVARDLGGETCLGFWSAPASCLSTMMLPIQLGLPFILPLILILIVLAIVPILRERSKK